MKIEFCWRLIFEILIIYKPSLGSCEVPHNINYINIIYKLALANKIRTRIFSNGHFPPPPHFSPTPPESQPYRVKIKGR